MCSSDLDHLEVKTVTAPPAGQPALVLTEGESGVWLENGNLIVSGPDSFRIQQNAWQLLRLMDRYYPGVNMSWMKIMEADEFRARMEHGQQAPFAIENFDETVDWKNFLKSNEETTATVPFGYSTEVTVPRTKNAPDVDGDLADAVWMNAVTVEDFRVVNSQESPKRKTKVQMLYDAENLYFAVKCYEPQMDQIADGFTDRDSPLWEGDDFEIRLAPRITAEEKKPYPFYVFAFSPSGVQAELLNMAHTVGDGNAELVLGSNWRDAVIGAEWNGVWRVKTKKTADGWSAEAVIPLPSIGLKPGEAVRILLGRSGKTVPEDSCWPLVTNGSFNSSPAFGSLDWQE